MADAGEVRARRRTGRRRTGDRRARSGPTPGWSTTCTTATSSTRRRSARAGASSSPTTAPRRRRRRLAGSLGRPDRAGGRRRRAIPAPNRCRPRHRRRRPVRRYGCRPSWPTPPDRRRPPRALRGGAGRGADGGGGVGDGGGAAARRGRPDRGQHGGQPGRADGHQRPDGAGQAARGQPADPEQPAGPDHRGQGELHPPDRLRRRRALGDVPALNASFVRRGRRAAGTRAWSRHRHVGPGAGRRPREVRRTRTLLVPVHQGGRHPRLPVVRPRLRGPGPQGALRQGRRPTTSPGPR